MEDQLWHRLETDGLLTRGEIGLARARHAAAGGAPDTAIIEVRPLSSEERAHLRRLLARVIDQPVAPPAFLDAPEADALAFVPRELADRFSVLAVRLTPQLLTVVAPAVPSRVLAELSFVAGRKVQPYVALESDIRHALARHLGLPMPPRFQALGAPQPTPPPQSPAAKPAPEALREVDRGWGQNTPVPGAVQLKALRGTEGATPLPGLGQRDWVARALETLRAAPDPTALNAELGHLAIPGMHLAVFLRVVGDRLECVAAAKGASPVSDATSVWLEPEVDSIIGRAIHRSATRCGPYREDPAFARLYRGLSLPDPGDVLVVPLKRGDRVLGVFIGDNGAQTIAPLTASAVRRLLGGLVEFWPVDGPATVAVAVVEPGAAAPTPAAATPGPDAPSAPNAPNAPTPGTLLGHPALRPEASVPLGTPSAPPAEAAAVAPAARVVHRPTAELVSLPPHETPPVEFESEPDAGLPEWELPGEPTATAPPRVAEGPEEPALVDLFTSADVAELALLDDPPPADSATATRPGVPVLETRPLLPAITTTTAGTPSIADTVVEMRPMALAELVDAMVAETRPTQTLAAVSALKEPAPTAPRPQLLDLDDMATVPAMARLRPRAAPDEPPPPPASPPSVQADAPPSASADPEPEPAPRGLPFPTPGWTDELPVPVVTAIRSVRADAEPSTEVEAPAVRFQAIAAGPSPTGETPRPTGFRPGFAPTPFDPPSGPMPRVTVTLTPRPVDPEATPPPAPAAAPVPAAPEGPTTAELATALLEAFAPAPARVEDPGRPQPPEAPQPAALPTDAPRRRVTDADVRVAIQDLSRPDASVRQQAEDLLLSVGEPALGPIFDAFPGHLVVDRFAQPAGAIAVEQHSALLRVIVRLGPLATGALEGLCAHLSPEIRYYAVYAFSTLRSQASLPVIATRLTDSDASVRDVAVHVLEQYRGQTAFKQFVAQVREELKAAPARRRRALVEAAGRLHLAETIPELVLLLGDLGSGLQEPAHRALQEIARADFGLDAWKWQKWLERNGHRPRVEWLLDGLLSDHRAIRAGAFQELRRLTHQNYGYLVDAPPAERRSGHERWLKWWRDVGMTRFAGYR